MDLGHFKLSKSLTMQLGQKFRNSKCPKFHFYLEFTMIFLYSQDSYLAYIPLVIPEVSVQFFFLILEKSLEIFLVFQNSQQFSMIEFSSGQKRSIQRQEIWDEVSKTLIPSFSSKVAKIHPNFFESSSISRGDFLHFQIPWFYPMYFDLSNHCELRHI